MPRDVFPLADLAAARFFLNMVKAKLLARLDHASACARWQMAVAATRSF